MSLSDPIGDMLTIIRNGSRRGHEAGMAKRSNLCLSILKVLKHERFIYDFKSVEDEKQGMIKIYLKAPEGTADPRRLRKINRLTRVSKPGIRRYANCQHIPRVLNGLGLCVLSTSVGVMSGDEARRKRVGGEVLLSVW